MTNVFAVPMDPDNNDARASTIGEYMGMLLHELWMYQDEFSGKRPFGNSGWEYDIFVALADAGLVEAERNEDYEEWTFSHEARREAHRLVVNAISKEFQL